MERRSAAKRNQEREVATPAKKSSKKLAEDTPSRSSRSKKTKEEGKENVDAFDMEQFANEVPDFSAIDRYFLNGKEPVKNRKHVQRYKKDRRGDRGEANAEKKEEEEEEDEGMEELETTKKGKGYTECNLELLRKFFEKERVKENSSEMVALKNKLFPEWTNYLVSGFNVLVHGIGSLRPMLSSYASFMDGYTVVEVEGYRQGGNARALLACLHELLDVQSRKSHDLVDWARKITGKSTWLQDVIIIVHGLDSPNFRESSDLEVLRVLAESSHFRIVASVSHVNRMMIFDPRSLASFKWVHVHADTWLPSEAEIFAGSSSLLGLDASSEGSLHSMSSLDVFWQSLNSNARQIFHALFSRAFAPDAEKSILFWDLFNLCKENFWVSSDAALRQQLVEFTDHRLARMTRTGGGNERIQVMVDRALVERFLEEKGMPLENDT